MFKASLRIMRDRCQDLDNFHFESRLCKGGACVTKDRKRTCEHGKAGKVCILVLACDLLWTPKIKGVMNTKRVLNGPPRNENQVEA